MGTTLSDYKLAAFAMDSTLLEEDSWFELAVAAGRQAAAEAVMRAGLSSGPGAFRQHLLERTSLLVDTPEAALHQVWLQRLHLRQGAREICERFKSQGLKLALITSGFSYFAQRVATELNIDFVRANVLRVIDGRLTGELTPQPWGQVCDGEVKVRMLKACMEVVGCSPAQTIVVGHGINDLPMLASAGLPVAFNAPESVEQHAHPIRGSLLDGVSSLVPTYGDWIKLNYR